MKHFHNLGLLIATLNYIRRMTLHMSKFTCMHHCYTERLESLRNVFQLSRSKFQKSEAKYCRTNLNTSIVRGHQNSSSSKLKINRRNFLKASIIGTPSPAHSVIISLIFAKLISVQCWLHIICNLVIFRQCNLKRRRWFKCHCHRQCSRSVSIRLL